MARELITSWEGYQTAIDRLLFMACQKICIYDEDLGQLKLESSLRLPQIKRILRAGHKESLQIIVRNAERLHNQSPLLIKLLTDFSHLATAQQSPPNMAHLRDGRPAFAVDSLHDVLSGKIAAGKYADKIVIIGVMAAVGKSGP